MIFESALIRTVGHVRKMRRLGLIMLIHKESMLDWSIWIHCDRDFLWWRGQPQRSGTANKTVSVSLPPSQLLRHYGWPIVARCHPQCHCFTVNHHYLIMSIPPKRRTCRVQAKPFPQALREASINSSRSKEETHWKKGSYLSACKLTKEAINCQKILKTLKDYRITPFSHILFTLLRSFKIF